MPIIFLLVVLTDICVPRFRPSLVKLANIFFRLSLGTLYSPHFFPLVVGMLPLNILPFNGLRVMGICGNCSSIAYIILIYLELMVRPVIIFPSCSYWGIKRAASQSNRNTSCNVACVGSIFFERLSASMLRISSISSIGA